MTLTPKVGYGPNCYTVRHLHEWDYIRSWLCMNKIDWWHVSSGPEGYGFQVKDNIEWFNLKWL
jgi:hypothetical protein